MYESISKIRNALSSCILYASRLMYALMLYVAEIDGAEDQWVAQLCGCKSRQPSVSLSEN